jgi:hypothetical protein
MNETKNDEKDQTLIKVILLINPETENIYAVGGDREPCSHGSQTCCDTEYIGFKWIKERMK